MRVCWVDIHAECASENVFSNIVAEVDELPIAFQRVSVSGDVDLTNVDTLENIRRQKNADALLWFSCQMAEMHVYSPLLETGAQTRVVARDNDGETPVEALSAIARNWLEGLLPLWQKANRNRIDEFSTSAARLSDTQTVAEKDAALDDPALNDDNEVAMAPLGEGDEKSEKVMPEFVKSDSQLAASLLTRRMLYAGLGLVISAPGNNRLNPGGYGRLSLKAGRYLEMGLLGAAMKSIELRSSGVKAVLAHYPLSAFLGMLLPTEGVVFFWQIGIEAILSRRKVFVDGESLSTLWKQQAAVAGMAGVKLPLGTRFFWVLQLGARIMLRNTVLQIEVGDTRVTVYSPWRVQPIMFTGVQAGIF